MRIPERAETEREEKEVGESLIKNCESCRYFVESDIRKKFRKLDGTGIIKNWCQYNNFSTTGKGECSNWGKKERLKMSEADRRDFNNHYETREDHDMKNKC